MPCPAERLNAAGDAPKPLRDVLTRARGAWLRSEHVVDLLRNYRLYNFPVSRAPPSPPPASGCLFLFNRRATRYFRRDGHSWRTKSDGKTVRETHEKLKVAGRDALNCYYAHTVPGGGSDNASGGSAGAINANGDDGGAAAATTAAPPAAAAAAAAVPPATATTTTVEGLQRRCYWLLSGDEGLVLVHYLAVAPPPSALRASQALFTSAALASLSASTASLCRAASAPVFSGRGGGGGERGGGGVSVSGNDSDSSERDSSLLSLRMLLPEGVTHEAGPRGVTVTTGGALTALGRSASGGGGRAFFFPFSLFLFSSPGRESLQKGFKGNSLKGDPSTLKKILRRHRRRNRSRDFRERRSGGGSSDGNLKVSVCRRRRLGGRRRRGRRRSCPIPRRSSSSPARLSP